MDAFEEVYWTASQVLAWVCWRDPQLMKDWPWRGFVADHLRLERVRSGKSPACNEELIEVTHALQRGEITAVRDGSRLPCEYWARRSLQYDSPEMFCRAEILGLWSERPSRSSNAAERRCETWLRGLATPDAASGTVLLTAHRKQHWWDQARARDDMEGLSWRGFERAWAKVAAVHPAIAKAGAKPKSGSMPPNRITTPK